MSEMNSSTAIALVDRFVEERTRSDAPNPEGRLPHYQVCDVDNAIKILEQQGALQVQAPPAPGDLSGALSRSGRGNIPEASGTTAGHKRKALSAPKSDNVDESRISRMDVDARRSAARTSPDPSPSPSLSPPQNIKRPRLSHPVQSIQMGDSIAETFTAHTAIQGGTIPTFSPMPSGGAPQRNSSSSTAQPSAATPRMPSTMASNGYAVSGSNGLGSTRFIGHHHPQRLRITQEAVMGSTIDAPPPQYSSLDDSEGEYDGFRLPDHGAEQVFVDDDDDTPSDLEDDDALPEDDEYPEADVDADIDGNDDGLDG